MMNTIPRWSIPTNMHDVSRAELMIGLLEKIEPEVGAAKIQAFRRTFLDGLPLAAVAAELGVSVNVVLLAKYRVLKRLRQLVLKQAKIPRLLGDDNGHFKGEPSPPGSLRSQW